MAYILFLPALQRSSDRLASASGVSQSDPGYSHAPMTSMSSSSLCLRRLRRIPMSRSPGVQSVIDPSIHLSNAAVPVARIVVDLRLCYRFLLHVSETTVL